VRGDLWKTWVSDQEKNRLKSVARMAWTASGHDTGHTTSLTARGRWWPLVVAGAAGRRCWPALLAGAAGRRW